MKKSKEIVNQNIEMNNILQGLMDQIENLSSQLADYNKKVKKEYSKILIEEKYNLLTKIAQGENIDINILKSKYLKSKELLNLTENTVSIDPKLSEDLLDRLESNGEIYYYENKEKGKVYNLEFKEIGVYKNHTITLH